MSKVRLDSWKSIAEYLERSSRTVQRWHTGHALPVHHFGGSKGSVFAYAEEIDRWLMSLAQESRLSDPDGDDALGARRSESRVLSLQASEMWESRSEQSLHTIAGLYRKAIDQNPVNAEALIGLANSMISSALCGVVERAIAYPAAAEAINKMGAAASSAMVKRCNSARLLVSEAATQRYCTWPSSSTGRTSTRYGCPEKLAFVNCSEPSEATFGQGKDKAVDDGEGYRRLLSALKTSMSPSPVALAN